MSGIGHDSEYFSTGRHTERNLQDLLQWEKKELMSNYKKTECLVISKRESPRCERTLRNISIKQVQEFNYLASVIKDGRVTEIR